VSQENVEIVRNAFDAFGAEGIDAGISRDRVVALVDMIGRIKDSRAEVSQHRGFVVSGFRDGAFGEIRTFPSWSDALKAVGLEE
jgi:hypothetical protein